ncbi:carbohydrate kinase family protein [Martelella radicis]|uniref:Sugar/nucleoside kinase (Ribokinase family) n=1 Tax=Martelella radicis TaxID=1397476 RepID=A0A7W6KLF3_9HYPH|nr:carbohydrate kinase family protein [Martelella radicis]MBB4123421.1 sugar/nucleoside kinase (ribokinase family) [Martelella radicis]
MNGAIYCLGPLVLDRVLTVDDLPGHDEKAFIKKKEERAGGPPLNCAWALSRLGEDARLVSTIGDDGEGAILMQWLAERDMSTEAVDVKADSVTASATIIVDRTGEKAILIDPVPVETLAVIGDRVSLQAGDTVVSNFFHPEAVARMFDRAAKTGIDRMIDLELPEIERWGWQAMENILPFASLVVTNRQVLEAWMARTGNDRPIGEAAEDLAHFLSGAGARKAVVTLGSGGLVAIDGDAVFYLDAFKVTPRNTTGAGDVFLAGLATAMRRGRKFEKALAFGTAAAAHFLETGRCDAAAAEALMKDKMKERL